jgi:hypothetical protein
LPSSPRITPAARASQVEVRAAARHPLVELGREGHRGVSVGGSSQQHRQPVPRSSTGAIHFQLVLLDPLPSVRSLDSIRRYSRPGWQYLTEPVIAAAARKWCRRDGAVQVRRALVVALRAASARRRGRES